MQSWSFLLSLMLLVIFVTPEGFTTTVTDEGLEKARTYLNRNCEINLGGGLGMRLG